MAKLTDPGVERLLAPAAYCTISTPNEDDSITSSIVWFNVEDGKVAINGAAGRRWTTNAAERGTIAFLVADPENPFDYVEVRGRAVVEGDEPEADAHIDRLTKRYIGQDSYPFRRPGEVRMRFVIEPTTIRHQKQG